VLVAPSRHLAEPGTATAAAPDLDTTAAAEVRARAWMTTWRFGVWVTEWMDQGHVATLSAEVRTLKQQLAKREALIQRALARLDARRVPVTATTAA
jgi:hypothetical protein